MADSAPQKGAEGTKMTSQSPSGASHGSSSPISRPATPSTSKKLTQKLGSLLRKHFSIGRGVHRVSLTKSGWNDAGAAYQGARDPQGELYHNERWRLH